MLSTLESKLDRTKATGTVNLDGMFGDVVDVHYTQKYKNKESALAILKKFCGKYNIKVARSHGRDKGKKMRQFYSGSTDGMQSLNGSTDRRQSLDGSSDGKQSLDGSCDGRQLGHRKSSTRESYHESQTIDYEEWISADQLESCADHLHTGQEIQVVVMVEDVAEADFVIQIIAHAGNLRHVMEELNKICVGDTCGMRPSGRIENTLAAARYNQDGLWYRARILHRDDHIINVFYIDFGNCAKVPYNWIRPLPRQLCRLPAQGVSCSLADVTLFKDASSRRYLVELLHNKVATARVTSIHKSVATVHLSLDDQSVAHLLVDNGCAIYKNGSDGIVSPDNQKMVKPNWKGEQVAVEYPELKPDLLGRYSLCIPLNDCSPEKLEEVFSKCGQIIDSSVTSRNLFIRFQDHDEAIAALHLGAKSYGARPASDRMSLKEIPQALAPHEEGTQMRIWKQQLKADSRGLYSICIPKKCLPFENVEKIFGGCGKIVEKYETVRCTVVHYSSRESALAALQIGSGPFGVYVAKSKVRNTSPVAGVSEPRDVHVRDGASLPVTSQGNVITEAINTGCSRKLLGLNISSLPGLMNCGRLQSVAAQLQPGQELYVLVVIVESPSMFWVQCLDQANTFLDLSTSITAHYSTIQDPDPDFLLTENCLVATPHEDNVYYRAQYLQATTGGAIVRYLDYGNTAKVPFCSLHQLLDEFCTVPAQAIPCRLEGICEENPSATKRFKMLVENKLVHAKVVKVFNNYVTSLQLFDGQASILESLTDK